MGAGKAATCNLRWVTVALAHSQAEGMGIQVAGHLRCGFPDLNSDSPTRTRMTFQQFFIGKGPRLCMFKDKFRASDPCLFAVSRGLDFDRQQSYEIPARTGFGEDSPSAIPVRKYLHTDIFTGKLQKGNSPYSCDSAHASRPFMSLSAPER